MTTSSLAARRSWALAFARTVLGLMFFMAGWWKVLELGPLEHARRFFVEPYEDTWIPLPLLWASGTLVPWVELLAGGLLLLGFRVRDALLALGGVLALVTYGHLLKEPLYSFSGHVVPRLVLLLFILFCPSDDDRWSIDAWWRGRRRSSETEPPAG